MNVEYSKTAGVASEPTERLMAAIWSLGGQIAAEDTFAAENPQ